MPVPKDALKKVFEKVLEKFGGSKNITYLCTTFRYEKMIGDFSNGSLIYWFLQRENVVFICQFL